jgi:hypothetical protein
MSIQSDIWIKRMCREQELIVPLRNRSAAEGG